MSLSEVIRDWWFRGALEQQEQMMGQFDDLRTAIGQLGTDLSEAVSRVETKIAALGDPDPDLSADIEALRAASAQLDALAADAVAEPEFPEEPPVDEPVGEEPVIEEPPIEEEPPSEV